MACTVGDSLRLPWRDREDSVQVSTASSSSTSELSAVASAIPQQGDFIIHKVSRLDTLAGVAIKYNVLVADIKRFNGLLSDSAMHGCTQLLIPKQLEPASEEVQRMFAEIATGLGRNPRLRTDTKSAAPGNAGISPSMLPRGGSFDGLSDIPWWCQCGGCSEEGDMEYVCPRSTFNQSVEHADTQVMTSAPSEPSGPTRLYEHMRRRLRRTQDLQGQDTTSTSTPVSWFDEIGQRLRAPQGTGLPTSTSAGGDPGPAAAAAAAAMFSNIGKAIRESAVVQKLKAAASAPSGSGARGLAEAADGVLASLRQGLLPKGNPAQLRVTTSPRSVTGQTYRKLGAKCD